MKKLKLIGIIFIIIVVCYIIFIGIELTRFNNSIGAIPLINIDKKTVNIDEEENTLQEKNYGIGYTIEYEYLVSRKDGSDSQLLKLISGEFKLFDKFTLNTWIV